jgi:carbon-monoxide dehydrogenase small subunit
MTMIIRPKVNGQIREIAVAAHRTLLEVIRDQLELRGAVEGCGVGVCGTCTVLVDDQPVSSCLMLATNADGRAVTTIEGVSRNGELSRIQQAFLDHQAFQCGFCTPGMIMAVEGMLRESPRPDESQIRDYLSGNLCRCGTYSAVIAAVKAVIDELVAESPPVP